MPKHALVVYNPAAGTAVNPDLWLGAIIHRLCEEAEYAVTVMPTRPGMEGRSLFANVSHPDLVVAAGGDGTVRFVLGACAESRIRAPVGILPLGTGNQLARNLGIYEDNILTDPLEDALKVLLEGKPFPIDLGLMNGHYFCVAAGAGPLSDAVILPDHQDKVNWKMLAYASSMIQTLALPPVTFRLTMIGESFTVQASGVFITNIADLGVGKLSESAEVNDGLLDLCVLNPIEFQDYLELGFRFAGGFVGGKAPYYIRKVSSLLVEVAPEPVRLTRLQEFGHKVKEMFTGKSEPPPPIHKEVIAMIDGDACGTTPMQIEVVPGAVAIIAPQPPEA
ncbi:MAG TPA: diacylglycerol kinase family protein [Candidatus Obscuribacterales bacterium]